MKPNKQELKQRVKCPKCEMYMRREEIEIPGPNIVIDHCRQCGSYWFDKGELNKYIRSKTPDKMLRRTSGLDTWGIDNCPRCKGKTSIKFLAEMEIDQCDECFGIWLDHGELKRIMESDIAKLKEPALKKVFERLRLGKGKD